MLYTSKTHDKGSKPQWIKIARLGKEPSKMKHFCPFSLMTKYMSLHGGFIDENEQFFVFRDHSPVRPNDARKVLKQTLKNSNINQSFYSFHSLRIGHASQLIRLGVDIEVVKRLGHWRSNAKNKYIKE